MQNISTNPRLNPQNFERRSSVQLNVEWLTITGQCKHEKVCSEWKVKSHTHSSMTRYTQPLSSKTSSSSTMLSCLSLKHTRQTWHFQEQQKPAWKVQLPYTFSFNLTHTLLYRATNWENIRWYMVIIMWKCVSTPARTFNEQRRHVARHTKKGKSLASRHSQYCCRLLNVNCTIACYRMLRYVTVAPCNRKPFNTHRTLHEWQVDEAVKCGWRKRSENDHLANDISPWHHKMNSSAAFWSLTVSWLLLLLLHANDHDMR